MGDASMTEATPADAPLRPGLPGATSRRPVGPAAADEAGAVGASRGTDARDKAGPDAPAGRVFVSSNTQLDLSSSAVRAVIAAGRDPRYLMPEAARRIILATGSYARPGEPEE